jgi:hypothetical protein
VALKVLPAAFLRDPERMARFQREAEVLASLDHPNIGHIHGIVDSEDSRALVLALIEGPTLADRIEAGPLRRCRASPIPVFSAVHKSRCDRRHTGASALKTATKAHTPMLKTRTPKSGDRSSARILSSAGSNPMPRAGGSPRVIRGRLEYATSVPTKPPVTASNKLSMNHILAMRPRLAPMARRTAASFSRAPALANNNGDEKRSTQPRAKTEQPSASRGEFDQSGADDVPF